MPAVNAPLTFGSPSMDFSGPQGLTRSYNSAYQNYANLNQQLYSNYTSNLNSMLGGYDALQGSVMRRLQGSNRANLSDIAHRYATLSGQASQQMIDRGLGNTTVQQSMQRGIAADRANESTRSRNMYAGLLADYQSKLGLAGLGAQGHGLDMLLSQVSAPAPDAGMYAQLAQMSAAGRMPGQLPGMPGASAPAGPTGGVIPPGLFAPSYDAGSGAPSGGGYGFGVWAGRGGGWPGSGPSPGLAPDASPFDFAGAGGAYAGGVMGAAGQAYLGSQLPPWMGAAGGIAGGAYGASRAYGGGAYQPAIGLAEPY